MSAVTEKLEAKFSQSRNDMHWSVFTLEDGFIRWGGYDDAYWWDNVSKADHTRTRTGEKSGKVYVIDFVTGEVWVTAAQELDA